VCSKSGPNTRLSQSHSRRISVPPIMAMAAIATPIWLPMPPRTTMATTMALSMKVKDSGLMKPWRAAKNEPAKPPKPAPMAKAVSLVLVVVMPSDRQGISALRIASPPPPPRRRHPPQAQRDPVGQQRQPQDDVEEEDGAVEGGELQAEEGGEAL